MRAGVLGTVDGEFSVVDSFSDAVVEDDTELTRGLDIRRVFSLPSGEMAFEGRAAMERLAAERELQIDYGEIRTAERSTTRTLYTEFVGVPGEFVVAASGRGTFAFDLVGRDTNTSIDRSTLDLDAFLDDRDDADVWKLGFDHEEGGNGVLHGSDVLDDEAARSLVDGATTTQLGLEYEADGRRVKMTAAASGYVEVYRPTDFDSGDFLQYLLDDVLPYVD